VARAYLTHNIWCYFSCVVIRSARVAVVLALNVPAQNGERLAGGHALLLRRPMNNRTDNSADDTQDRTADKQAETAENDNKHFGSSLC
jgi:hypothetical protein